jgi:hypothetical protein
MSVRSIDDVKQEIDALVRRCSRLRNDDERREHIALCERQLLNADWTTVGSPIYAAGSGPEATSFFLLESTVRLRPSNVRAPRRMRSPGSAKTTSSVVNVPATLRIAKPTLRVMTSPFAMMN